MNLLRNHHEFSFPVASLLDSIGFDSAEYCRRKKMLNTTKRAIATYSACQACKVDGPEFGRDQEFRDRDRRPSRERAFLVEGGATGHDMQDEREHEEQPEGQG